MGRIPDDKKFKVSEVEKLATQRRFDAISKNYDRQLRKLVGDLPVAIGDPEWSLKMSGITHALIRTAAYTTVMQGTLMKIRDEVIGLLRSEGLDLPDSADDLPAEVSDKLQQMINERVGALQANSGLDKLESDARAIFDQTLDIVVNYFIASGADICDLTRGEHEVN